MLAGNAVRAELRLDFIIAGITPTDPIRWLRNCPLIPA